MRRRTLGVKKEPTIMIIPMIDIVFFLLVFFMVGTLYMNTEQQIPLNLPSASTSTAKSIEPITITLTTTHTLYIDNQEIFRPLGRRGTIYRETSTSTSFCHSRI